MTTSWGAPARAYELTAEAAEGGTMLARQELRGLDPDELPGMVIALGAHARHAAVISSASAVRVAEVRRAQRHIAEGMQAPDTRQVVLAALDGPEEALAALVAPADILQDAAVALIGLITGTLRAAGWAPASIAFLCRRSAAV